LGKLEGTKGWGAANPRRTKLIPKWNTRKVNGLTKASKTGEEENKSMDGQYVNIKYHQAE